MPFADKLENNDLLLPGTWYKVVSEATAAFKIQTGLGGKGIHVKTTT